jgi:hypothetical protein
MIELYNSNVTVNNSKYKISDLIKERQYFTDGIVTETVWEVLEIQMSFGQIEYIAKRKSNLKQNDTNIKSHSFVGFSCSRYSTTFEKTLNKIQNGQGKNN